MIERDWVKQVGIFDFWEMCQMLRPDMNWEDYERMWENFEEIKRALTHH